MIIEDLEEAKKELFNKGAERESFGVALKKSASLPGDGEEDISEGVTWEGGLEIDVNFK